MKSFIVFDPTSGEITHTGFCQDADLALQAPSGFSVIEGAGTTASGYIAAGAFVAYTSAQAAAKAARPIYASGWSNATMSWTDGRTLAQAQADQWAIVKAARDTAILAAGTTPVGTFDTTPDGRANITSVAVMLMANSAIASVEFTLANNTRPTIARADFLTAAQTIGAAVQALYTKADGLRTQINAAVDIATVLAVVWA